MKIIIDAKNNNPYNAIANIIEEDIIKRDKYFGTAIVKLWTSNLGFMNTILYYDGDAGNWYWQTDWYEGGDVALYGYVLLDDIDFEQYYCFE